MKKRSMLKLAVCVGMVVLFSVAGLQAGTEVSDVIQMKNEKYEKHKKSIATFTHKKHAEDYAVQNPELYKSGCGECHHDENNKPLDLKMGDDVQDCIECHKIASRPPKKKKGEPKLTKSEKLEYHAYAIHENCKSCHKKFNKAKGTKAAPTTCKKCHPKKS